MTNSYFVYENTINLIAMYVDLYMIKLKFDGNEFVLITNLHRYYFDHQNQVTTLTYGINIYFRKSKHYPMIRKIIPFVLSHWTQYSQQADLMHVRLYISQLTYVAVKDYRRFLPVVGHNIGHPYLVISHVNNFNASVIWFIP